jgi:hypothetical protein
VELIAQDKKREIPRIVVWRDLSAVSDADPVAEDIFPENGPAIVRLWQRTRTRETA